MNNQKQVRIAGGILKSRTIKIPINFQITRPTSDILKCSIFNILLHRFEINFEFVTFIDVFAGSGAIGIEAISRGSKKVYFIDSSKNAIQAIHFNIKALGIEEHAKVFEKDITKLDDSFIKNMINDDEKIIIFMDPPYAEQELLISQIKRFKTLFQDKALVVAETSLNILNLCGIKHSISHGKKKVFFI